MLAIVPDTILVLEKRCGEVRKRQPRCGPCAADRRRPPPPLAKRGFSSSASEHPARRHQSEHMGGRQLAGGAGLSSLVDLLRRAARMEKRAQLRVSWWSGRDMH